MSKPSQHVIPKDTRWSVLRAGNMRSTKTFKTQAEAVAFARDIARNQGTELFIHGNDGRIRERDSYVSGALASKS